MIELARAVLGIEAPIEVERKWRMPFLPDIELGTAERYRQGYLQFQREVPGELRLRSIGGRDFYLTTKGDGDLKRFEYPPEETPHNIPRELFEMLWPATEGVNLEKDRFTVTINGVTYYIDRFVGRLAGLYLLEVEFKATGCYSAEQLSHQFQLPLWVPLPTVEVTYDKGYKNKNLAKAIASPLWPPG